MFRFNPHRPTDRRSAVLDTSDRTARKILNRARAAARNSTDPQPRSSLRRELDELTTGQLKTLAAMRRLTDGRAPLPATTVNAEARAALNARDAEQTAKNPAPGSGQLQLAGMSDGC